MNAFLRPLLISVGVDGAIGRPLPGAGLLVQLSRLTPLPVMRAQEIMRDRLLTQPALTEPLVAQLCDELLIPRDDFPGFSGPVPFTLFAYSLKALREISRIAPVVLLANASCVDFDADGLRRSLSPWVSGIFSSCDIGYAKPDPQAFHCIARRYEVSPGQSVHIGEDWTSDARGALAAGLQAIWLSHGRPVPEPGLVARGHITVAADLAEAAHLVCAGQALGSEP